jgi:hypothetical protein
MVGPYYLRIWIDRKMLRKNGFPEDERLFEMMRRIE